MASVDFELDNIHWSLDVIKVIFAQLLEIANPLSLIELVDAGVDVVQESVPLHELLLSLQLCLGLVIVLVNIVDRSLRTHLGVDIDVWKLRQQEGSDGTLSSSCLLCGLFQLLESSFVFFKLIAQGFFLCRKWLLLSCLPWHLILVEAEDLVIRRSRFLLALPMCIRGPFSSMRLLSIGRI